MPCTLLVIDDDAAGCRLLAAIFKPKGFEVIAAHNARLGLERVAADRPDLVLLDLRLPDIDGLEVLAQLRKSDPDLPVIILTAHGEVKSAVRATQLGAFDYLNKPIDHEEIAVIVERALETMALKAEVEDLRRQVGDGGSLGLQMGPSPQSAQIIEQIKTVAASNLSVLILGETGTGKELIAEAIHRQSDRRTKPFVALDCGAIPEALLESELFGYERGAFTGAEKRKEGSFHLAEGGTLLLDEVGNLPMSLQAKLLRVLESRQLKAIGATRALPMDVRFIAATNDDLQARANDGRFRVDLYFRLAQYTISPSPLRDRPMDIGYLARRFMAAASLEFRRPMHELAPDAVRVLEEHSWPGNIRELRNVIRQAVLESKDLVLSGDLLQRFLLRHTAPPSSVLWDKSRRNLKEVAENAAREAERRLICEILPSDVRQQESSSPSAFDGLQNASRKDEIFGDQCARLHPLKFRESRSSFRVNDERENVKWEANQS